MVVRASTRTIEILLICDITKKTLTSKRYVAKRSLQRPLNNQILNYKSFLELCKAEIKHITFVGIDKLRMAEVHDSLKKRFESGNTIPGTKSNHHFTPNSTSEISYKLTSEHEACSKFDFNSSVFKAYNISELQVSTYVS